MAFVVWLCVPDVPLMTRMWVPTGAVWDMARFSVEVFDPATGITIDGGLNVGVTPVGTPETPRDITAV